MTSLRRLRAAAGERLKPTAVPPLWTLVLQGDVDLETADGMVRLRAGDAALVGVRTAHRLIAVDAAEVVVSDLQSLLPPSWLSTPFVVSGFAERHPALAQLVASCPLAERGASSLWRRSYAGLLGAAMWTSWQESHPHAPREQDAAVADLLAMLARDPGARWTLSRMAASVHLSPSALGARIRRATGRTPSEVLRELRMREARRLLVESSQPIGSVAFTVGYGSTAAFSRAFSNRHGVAPQDWRAGSPPACDG